MNYKTHVMMWTPPSPVILCTQPALMMCRHCAFSLLVVAVRHRAVVSFCACTCLFSQSSICLLFLCCVEISAANVPLLHTYKWLVHYGHFCAMLSMYRAAHLLLWLVKVSLKHWAVRLYSCQTNALWIQCNKEWKGIEKCAGFIIYN